MNSNTETIPDVKLDQLCVNTIRFLSVDAVQKANSGHPGLPLDAAPMAFVLWTKIMKYNPKNPLWFDRDRFVLSAGHGSMLLYSMLHLTGYSISMDEIKQFRQWGSITPGHPEYGVTPGVETTTGPLGQGFGNAVGLAMAEAYLGARYNKPGFDLIDHHTYCLVSDGDLMEGISSEAASLAGHLKLGKLICLYDNNHITLSASTNLAFSDNHEMRFRSYGWQTITVDDGNDLRAIEKAITEAKNEKERPTLILVRTHIGYGSPGKQDTFEAHGSPLGEEEVKKTKKNLGWPEDRTFYVPGEAAEYFHSAGERGKSIEQEWNNKMASYAGKYPEAIKEFRMVMCNDFPDKWDSDIPVFPTDEKGMATRVASGKIMNAFFSKLPGFIGGSADLNPSTHTELKGAGTFQFPVLNDGEDTQGSSEGGFSYAGRNIFYGVREHAMAAISNGLAGHGGILPFCATFLTFSDYMRPAIRLASLMKIPVIFIFTHDSIGLGEDGPTHQSIEHVAGLRIIPDLIVIRPCDANETAEAWRFIVNNRRAAALILSRQNLPVLDRNRYTSAAGLHHGAYILSEAKGNTPEIILIATGSEVRLVAEAQRILEQRGIAARVVSMPSWEIFEAQSPEYKERVLPGSITARLAVEAGVPQGWEKYTGQGGDILAIDHFGASAPGEVVMREFGFTIENVVKRAMALLKK